MMYEKGPKGHFLGLNIAAARIVYRAPELSMEARDGRLRDLWEIKVVLWQVLAPHLYELRVLYRIKD